jgi:glutamyl-tRNA reductase
LLYINFNQISLDCSTDISTFFVAGINYKKTDALTRGQFAINPVHHEAILASASRFGGQSLFVLSTCNRTEIYGLARHAGSLIDLLCTYTQGSKEMFLDLAYVKEGRQAVEHLFAVGAGLDSQILGDYEIVGQLKQAVKFAKQRQGINAFMERLVNATLQASKLIKNQTALSGGTVSVSFAAVQCIREKFAAAGGKHILLIGAGKIGRNTCKNLIDYLDTKNITLINRSDDRAQALAAEMGLRSAGYDRLHQEVQRADIIIVATNAEQAVIKKEDLTGLQEKLLIDLSIPNNIETSCKELPQITLVNVDDLSRINDATLQKRQAEIPKAIKIIDQSVAEFLEWHEMRRHVPVLKAVKTKLNEIHNSALFMDGVIPSPISSTEEKIQRVINGMASKMRLQNRQGCHYIEAIHDFVTEISVRI